MIDSHDAHKAAQPVNPPEGDPIYTPAPGEVQFTWRAIVAGCGLGAVIASMNVYMGLTIGFTFGGSLIAAILGFAIFRSARRPLTVLETNITQTTGSGAGTMTSAAGLVACIPALIIVGYEIEWYVLYLWAASVAFIGVFFAVPLRRQMVRIEKLRFPTGTATAHTILAMFAEAGEAVAKARALIFTGIAAGAFTMATYFIPQLGSPPVSMWFLYLGSCLFVASLYFFWRKNSQVATLLGVYGVAVILLGDRVPVEVLAVAAAWTFKFYMGPMLFGAGIIIGPRVCFSMMGGAILAWAIVGPMAHTMGWAPGPITGRGSYENGVKGWLLWPGVALMVSEALTSLALQWKTFVRAFRSGSGSSAEGGPALPPEKAIPNHWWILGLCGASILTMSVAGSVFDIPWYLTLIAIALSAVLAAVAVRSVGETDINPVGGMGKVNQLVFGGLAPGMMSTNLLAAGISAAGASQAGDMMQDLKTGHLLGASPRRQFQAQLIGVLAGIVFCVPAFLIITSAYEFGSDQLPAPAALAWAGVAKLLVNGFDSLPPHAVAAMAIATIIGIMIPVLRTDKKLAPKLPSGLAIGIAFIIPAYFSMIIFFGAVAMVVWKNRSPQSFNRLGFAVASGFIVGEGLLGIVKAALTLLGVPTLTGP